MVSHSHFVEPQRRFAGMSFDERLVRLIDEGVPTRGTWSENVRAWRTRRAPTIVIRFEELIAEPVRAVSEAVASLGVTLPVASGRLATFEQLHERRPRIFRSGVVGGWRDEMPAPIEERFWRAHGDEMEALGYAR